MQYNPKIHNRRSIRLKGYDYSQAGFYFITLCCQNRTSFYGAIQNGEMVLNDAGKMIHRWYAELENKFADIQCHEMIVMPNHFHCIIQNVGTPNPPVGADPRVCPNTNTEPNTNTADESEIMGGHVGPPQPASERAPQPASERPPEPTSLATVIQWFKTMTTNEYIRNVKSNNWKRFDGKLWQRNYWEHIIRNERAYHNIAEYIKSNPQNWKKDSLH